MKFLNIDYKNRAPERLVLKHVCFAILWIAGLAIFIFRIDTLLYSLINLKRIEFSFLAPAIFLFLIFLLFKNQQWYYTIAFIFYPVLLFLWFIPKWILYGGKIYIFLYYVGFIVKIFAKFKKALIVGVVSTFLLLLLIFGNSIFFKEFSLLFFSYIYYLFFKNFLREILKPKNFLNQKGGLTAADYLDPNSSKSKAFIQNLEIQSSDQKLSAEEKEIRVKERLLNTHDVYEYLIQSLSGFKNERSYTLFCIFQLFLYLSVTVFFFSFINYQLYQVDSNFFSTTAEPSFFDFIYYTLKTITFGNIESLKPNSQISKGVEILSFLLLGIFLLVIVVSLLFSLQRQKLKEIMDTSAKTLQSQNKILSNHIEKKYGSEVKDYDTGFTKWIRGVIDQIL